MSPRVLSEEFRRTSTEMGFASSDEGLFEQYAEGMQEAFAVLYHRHADDLVDRLMRVFRFDQSTADDVAQQTWLAVDRERHNAVIVKSFVAWLWKRAKNLAVTEKRRIKAKKRLHVYRTIEGMEHLKSIRIDDRHDYVDEQNERIHAIVDAINELPEEMRYAIRAVHLQGQPLTSVACAIGVPESTLRGRIERAMEVLKMSLLD